MKLVRQQRINKIVVLGQRKERRLFLWCWWHTRGEDAISKSDCCDEGQWMERGSNPSFSRKVNKSQPGGSGEADPLRSTSYWEAKKRNSKINLILFHRYFIIMLQRQRFLLGQRRPWLTRPGVGGQWSMIVAPEKPEDGLNQAFVMLNRI